MRHINQRKYSYIPYPQYMDYPDDPYAKNGTVRSGGCGLCSACMIVDQLTTQTLSVRECTKLSMAIGANHCDGTDMHILGPAIAEKFNLEFSKTNDLDEVLYALHNGGKVIALVSHNQERNKGIFTQYGHYITLISADAEEVCVLDPSWNSQKYTKWVKEGLVRQEGTMVYVTPQVLDDEGTRRETRFFIFYRKKTK